MRLVLPAPSGPEQEKIMNTSLSLSLFLPLSLPPLSFSLSLPQSFGKNIMKLPQMMIEK
jgi:hypothetical protein